MDSDLTITSPYYQLLKAQRDNLDFLMPQFYNGITRPVIDGFANAVTGSVSTASVYTNLANDLFNFEPEKVMYCVYNLLHKFLTHGRHAQIYSTKFVCYCSIHIQVVFGFCISDCGASNSNANAVEAVAVLQELKSYNSNEFQCNGGAFFWVGPCETCFNHEHSTVQWNITFQSFFSHLLLDLFTQFLKYSAANDPDGSWANAVSAETSTGCESVQPSLQPSLQPSKSSAPSTQYRPSSSPSVSNSTCCQSNIRRHNNAKSFLTMKFVLFPWFRILEIRYAIIKSVAQCKWCCRVYLFVRKVWLTLTLSLTDTTSFSYHFKPSQKPSAAPSLSPSTSPTSPPPTSSPTTPFPTKSPTPAPTRSPSPVSNNFRLEIIWIR